jgi:hypothetical protein
VSGFGCISTAWCGFDATGQESKQAESRNHPVEPSNKAFSATKLSVYEWTLQSRYSHPEVEHSSIVFP